MLMTTSTVQGTTIEEQNNKEKSLSHNYDPGFKENGQ